MAETQLATNRSPIISMEQQTSVFGTSATFAVAGFTIPAGAYEIHCYPSAACHIRNNGTATTGDGSKSVRSGQLFVVAHDRQTTLQVIGDGGAITLTVAYLK